MAIKNRVSFRPWGILTVIAAVVLNACTPAEKAIEKPNIILCMTDDQGWGDVGFHGLPYLKTPNLDAMASSGIQFDRFYSAASVCSSTRASCLTGRHPFRYGIFSANTGHMPQQALTLAEALRQYGYTTGHFGKWHLGTMTVNEKDANRGMPGDSSHYSPPGRTGLMSVFQQSQRYLLGTRCLHLTTLPWTLGNESTVNHLARITGKARIKK